MPSSRRPGGNVLTPAKEAGEAEGRTPRMTHAPARRSTQVYFDSRTHATFFARFTDQGMATLETRVGELAVQKTVGPDGHLLLTVRAGDDEVSLNLGAMAIDISRGGRSYHLDFSNATESDFLRVKRLLAGSRAIWLFRILASGLDATTMKTPAGVATLLSDALLGLLDGDVAAVDRLGQFLVKARQGTLRRVRREDGCYQAYETEVCLAWDDYVACKMAFSMFNPIRQACTVRWMVWVESAWFSFLSCTAFPLRTD